MNFIILVRRVLCHTKFALRRPIKNCGREEERERELKEEEDGARVNPWDFLNVKLAL